MPTQTYSRRSVLRAGAGAAVGSVAIANARPTRAQESFDGWLDGVGNYDGVVDETGSDEVTVEVGVDANGGQFGFGPAAVRVDPGTTVTWEWVGGNHNVVDDAGNFESELTGENGFTFSQTFDTEGVVKYYCTPHQSLGMRGVVVVGGEGGGGESSSSEDAADAPEDGGQGSGSDGGLTAADWGVVGLAVSLAAGLLSPLAFAAVLRRKTD